MSSGDFVDKFLSVASIIRLTLVVVVAVPPLLVFMLVPVSEWVFQWLIAVLLLSLIIGLLIHFFDLRKKRKKEIKD
jgi:uncharacterized membrane protein